MTTVAEPLPEDTPINRATIDEITYDSVCKLIAKIQEARDNAYKALTSVKAKRERSSTRTISREAKLDKAIAKAQKLIEKSDKMLSDLKDIAELLSVEHTLLDGDDDAS